MSSNYPVNFYFELSFNDEGKDTVAFQEVSGLSKEITVEEIAEGGENRFKYKLPSASKFTNLILKRALVTNNSELITWCTNSIDSGLANTITTKTITVKLLTADGTRSMIWEFHNAYPVKYSISDLKSQENAVVIESVELAYTYFTMK